MYQFLKYIQFLIQSTNQHGVHSPFVYDLITNCFYDKKKHEDYKTLKTYKGQLVKSEEHIKVTDLGEGSKRLKTTTRLVKDIAKTSASLDKSMFLMYRLFDYFNFSNALELGMSLGVATNAMALGNPKCKITTIEGCPNTSKFTATNLKNSGVRNVEFLDGHFKNVLPTLENESFDFIFFDGHHNKQATLDYFEMLLPKAHNDSVFIFDDIHWSKGMTEAWEEIKRHPKVTATINTYFWGFVFFRKEQQKEHFKIRV